MQDSGRCQTIAACDSDTIAEISAVDRTPIDWRIELGKLLTHIDDRFDSAEKRLGARLAAVDDRMADHGERLDKLEAAAKPLSDDMRAVVTWGTVARAGKGLAVLGALVALVKALGDGAHWVLNMMGWHR